MRLAVILSILMWTATATADKAKERIQAKAQAYADAILQWVDVEGTGDEDGAYARMIELRKDLVAAGPPAIEEVVLHLEHEHPNVRRGNAIALLAIVDENNVTSQILLDKVLLRMVEDPDLKTRSNLYHVSRKLINNLREQDRRTQAAARIKTVD